MQLRMSSILTPANKNSSEQSMSMKKLYLLDAGDWEIFRVRGREREMDNVLQMRTNTDMTLSINTEFLVCFIKYFTMSIMSM